MFKCVSALVFINFFSYLCNLAVLVFDNRSIFFQLNRQKIGKDVEMSLTSTKNALGCTFPDHRSRNKEFKTWKLEYENIFSKK